MTNASNAIMSNKTLNQHNKSRRPYIEPSIRVIAGFLLIIIGFIIFENPTLTTLMLAFLFFISFNLFQSGFSGFCLMEKILHSFGFRSELAEIKELSNEAQKAVAIQQNYMKTLNLLSEAILELSVDGTILGASDGWYKLVEPTVTSEQTIGRTLASFSTHSSDENIFNQIYENIIQGEDVFEVRFQLSRADNREQWALGKFMLEESAEESPPRIRGVLRDITESYLHEREIQHIALHDALTGLPNRILLDDRLKVAISDADKYDHKFGVLFIDLDNFKQVNDELGHKTGDRLLVSITSTMNQRIRKSDTLARWGGDEFILLLPKIKDESDLRKIANSLMSDMNNTLASEEFGSNVTLSIGGAVYPDHATNQDLLLMNADKSLYHAKGSGKNNVKMYSELA